MTNVNVRVAATEDNAHDDNSGFPGYVNPTDGLFISNVDADTMYTGLRFLNVNIPEGATIDDADVEVRRRGFDSDGSEDCDVFCEEAASPAAYTSGSSPRVRSLTTASVNWTMGVDGGDDDPEITPDLAVPIQEVVDSQGALTHLSFVIEGNTNADAFVYSFALDSTKAALLDLNYTAGAGGGTILPMVAAHYYGGPA